MPAQIAAIARVVIGERNPLSAEGIGLAAAHSAAVKLVHLRCGMENGLPGMSLINDLTALPWLFSFFNFL